MGNMKSIYAEITWDLKDAHDVMERYGEWATATEGGPGRCGSAEGRYQAPGGQALEDRRAPVRSMPNDRAMRVHKALLEVDQLHRGVLVALYVRPWGAAAYLRRMRIPPQLSQVRHLQGLRLFWPAFQRHEQAVKTVPARAVRIASTFG